MPTSRILYGKQIADRLGCSTRNVSRLYQAGKLPGAFKMGRTSPIKIAERDLARLLKGKP